MKRFLTVLLGSLVVALVLPLPSFSQQVQPNFVWIVGEDCSQHYFDLYNTNGAPTPAIASLASGGVIFDHAFANAPVCSVARSTLISGCYMPRLGSQFHRRRGTPMPVGLRFFPAYLRDAGYYTANNKKKDYNLDEGANVWNESSGTASWTNRSPGQPFFYYQTITDSHESKLHFDESDVGTQPTVFDPDTVVVQPRHPDTALFRYTGARYRDRVMSFDNGVSNVVAQLEADGLLEDTFVFVFGDNGGALPGSKGYAYETGLHVPLVVHIPTNFVHLVDLTPGTRPQGFASFVDFGPTLLHLAGISVPTGMDGTPFMGPGITLAETEARDTTYGYADRFDEKYDLVRTIRKGRYKYMRSYQPFNFDSLYNEYRYKQAAYREWRDLFKAGQLNAVQSQFFLPRPPEALYDVENDPYETLNLAENPSHTNKLVELRSDLVQKLKSWPDLSFYPESHLVSTANTNPTGFGQTNSLDIAALIDIADLSLVPFADAQAGIQSALDSTDPWRRYWGLIACSSHGTNAAVFYEQARILMTGDPERLVRTRAAEFLGLTGADDPVATLNTILPQAADDWEALLMLNTMVLLSEGSPGYYFGIEGNEYPSGGGQIVKRLSYLSSFPDPFPPPPIITVAVQQAEDAAISNATVKSSGSGWNGTGYVDLLEGGYVEFTFEIPSSGSYDLEFNTAGNTDNMAAEITVNGTVVNSALAVPNTGSWSSNWVVVVETDVALNAGTNTVRFADNGNKQPQIDQLQVIRELAGFSAWSNAYQLVNGPLGHDDADSLNNLYEYGLGGNPTNPLNTGYAPQSMVMESGGSNWFYYIHPQLSDTNSGIRYRLELSDNLISNVWARIGYEIIETNTDGFAGGLDAVTNRVPTELKEQQFIKLIIEEE